MRIKKYPDKLTTDVVLWIRNRFGNFECPLSFHISYPGLPLKPTFTLGVTCATHSSKAFAGCCKGSSSCIANISRSSTMRCDVCSYNARVRDSASTSPVRCRGCHPPCASLRSFCSIADGSIAIRIRSVRPSTVRMCLVLDTAGRSSSDRYTP
jgi:hypothetical protein